MLTVNQLVEKFNFEVLAGHVGLDKEITEYSLKRPSAELAGYLEHLTPQRIQVYGRTELGLLQQFDDSVRRSKLSQVMLSEVPCVIITRGLTIPLEFIELASERKIPLLTTPRSSTQLFYLLIRYLINQLAPSTNVQGVLVDVYGVGLMITGERGIGKSEAALELIKRGHLLVAADVVKVRRVDEERLLGTAPKRIRNQLEVRGLGILDVTTLFGAGSVREEKVINFIVHLEEWQQDKDYDRIGLEPPKTRQILGISVPEILIPVRPGRNLATLIEVAVIQNWNHNFRVHVSPPLRD
ncbi:HPr(Ser) kinase/phosphatase [Desulfosporosinus meridiei]|uniref:HPr kinase/phosphorylase n=1 Tax=Desulfosporosinus meridiei (strain ATCC BAA-275 / DSM 13257 / KCTC 12902 / NCIMB 13706 / S10) TaxID=768704 RepID=J7ITK4_DESMD|nr:HPr(Ser) kinase/phosphatase [Desulfosporosinus meridiei]AFQ43494.1 serine kinase of the HPr protein, regulates carbohydrate metabolism [Desulfosporosinus meridiei DSM 13257]